MKLVVADRSSSASASAFNSRSNDSSLSAIPPAASRSRSRMTTRRKLSTLRRSFTQHLAAVAKIDQCPLELAIAPPRRCLDHQPTLAGRVMLEQRVVEPLEILPDLVERVGGMLDNQVEQNQEWIACARGDAVLALLRQPGKPAGTTFGHRDQRPVALDELHRDQLRLTGLEPNEQQGRERDVAPRRPPAAPKSENWRAPRARAAGCRAIARPPSVHRASARRDRSNRHCPAQSRSRSSA